MCPHGLSPTCRRRPRGSTLNRGFGIKRLRASAVPLVQASLAAGLAWLVASELFDDQRPFFAPVAAILTLGMAAGQRVVRGLEIGIGVTLGIAVADLLVEWIGVGPWQLVVVILLAMSVAVALGGSPGVVGQTGVSAAFVVALEDPEGFDFARTAHTAIGVTAALLMSYVVLPIDPLRLVRDAAGPVLAELAGTLDDVAAALAAHDPEAATAALQRARSTDPLAAQFAGALVAGRETALAALPRRRALEAIETYGAAGAQLDLAVRNVRVIARAARRVLEKGDRVPSEACEALRELAAAVRALEPWLRDHTEVEEIRRRAVAAAARADAALEHTADLFVTTIVVSVRSAAIDVLRGTGLERDEALALVRPGAG